MFLELVDEVIFFLTHFIKRRENWFWALKQKNAHNFLLEKNVEVATFYCHIWPFTPVYLEIISWLLGPNIV